jgi:hypothetical protein
MLEANPSLTPNLVKAVLQFTAEGRSAYSHLTQGAGFLNARGAVQLAQSLANPLATAAKDPTPWSRQIIWGNRRVSGGVLKASASAWQAGVLWGAPASEDGGTIVWGTRCAAAECDDELWGAFEPATREWGADDEQPAGVLLYPDATGSASHTSSDHGRSTADARRSHAAILPDRARRSRHREEPVVA